jgi:hypothetical protein
VLHWDLSWAVGLVIVGAMELLMLEVCCLLEAVIVDLNLDVAQRVEKEMTPQDGLP